MCIALARCGPLKQHVVVQENFPAPTDSRDIVPQTRESYETIQKWSVRPQTKLDRKKPSSQLFCSSFRLLVLVRRKVRRGREDEEQRNGNQGSIQGAGQVRSSLRPTTLNSFLNLPFLEGMIYGGPT